MKKIGYRNGKWAAVWRVTLLVATLGGLAGCAATTAGHEGAEVVRTVWQGRGQFVAIEQQDRGPGGAPAANDHPADIPADRLRSAFAAVHVRLPGRDNVVPLFHDPELRILGDNIHAGLAAAGPGEDVTFAVIGQHALLAGFLKERKVTAGRVFCRNGRLTIIFGDVLRDVKDNEDRRLSPLLGGSRAAAPPHDWTLATQAGSEAFAMERPDWITFPLAGAAVSGAAIPPPEEAGNPVREPAKTVPPAAPAEPSVSRDERGIVNRLMLLRELLDKNLITGEEYRDKRQQILNGL